MRGYLLAVTMSTLILATQVQSGAVRGKEPIYEASINGIEFQEVERLISLRTIRPTPSSFDISLGEDNYILGNVLISFTCSISSISTLLTSTQKIEVQRVGHWNIKGSQDGIGNNSRFSKIRSFTHISKNRVIILDRKKLRIWHRENNSINSFTGICQKTELYSSMSVAPSDISTNQLTNTVYILDRTKIFSVNLNTCNEDIITTSFLRPFHSFTINKNANKFYFTHNYGIATYNIEKKHFERYTTAKSRFGNKDGDLNKALFDHPSAVAPLDSLTILVADADNYKLRVVDLAANRVTSICTGENAAIAAGNNNGAISECSVGRISDILFQPESSRVLLAVENSTQLYQLKLRHYKPYRNDALQDASIIEARTFAANGEAGITIALIIIAVFLVLCVLATVIWCWCFSGYCGTKEARSLPGPNFSENLAKLFHSYTKPNVSASPQAQPGVKEHLKPPVYTAILKDPRTSNKTDTTKQKEKKRRSRRKVKVAPPPLPYRPDPFPS